MIPPYPSVRVESERGPEHKNEQNVKILCRLCGDFVNFLWRRETEKHKTSINGFSMEMAL